MMDAPLIAIVVGKSEARPAAPRVPVISVTAATVWVHILLIGCLLGGAGATTPPPAPPVQPGACQEQIPPGKCYLYAGTNDEECGKFFLYKSSDPGYRICYYRPDKGNCWAGGPCVVGNTDGVGGSTCDTCVIPPPSAPPPPSPPTPSPPPPSPPPPSPSPPPCNMVLTGGGCGSGKGPCQLDVCCSPWGWCGTSNAHCNNRQTAYSNGGSCAPEASPPPSAPPPWWEFCGDATCNSIVAETEAPSSL